MSRKDHNRNTGSTRNHPHDRSGYGESQHAQAPWETFHGESRDGRSTRPNEESDAFYDAGKSSRDSWSARQSGDGGLSRHGEYNPNESWGPGKSSSSGRRWEHSEHERQRNEASMETGRPVRQGSWSPDRDEQGWNPHRSWEDREALPRDKSNLRYNGAQEQGYGGRWDNDRGYGADRSHGPDRYPMSDATYGASNRSTQAGAETHFGRGPKGYQRSDDRIKEEVCEALTADHHVDAREIDIEVSAGVVTLKGIVESRRMRRDAEACIENLRGVKDVQNELRVQTSATSAAGSENMKTESMNDNAKIPTESTKSPSGKSRNGLI